MIIDSEKFWLEFKTEPSFWEKEKPHSWMLVVIKMRFLYRD